MTENRKITDEELESMTDEQLGTTLRAALRAADQVEEQATKTEAQQDPRAEGYINTARELLLELEEGNIFDPGCAPVHHSINTIYEYLGWAGASITDLDETGQTSYSDMQTRIQNAEKTGYAASAHTRLESIENPTHSSMFHSNPSGILNFVYHDVAMAQGLSEQIEARVDQGSYDFGSISELDLTLLDPTGKSTHEEIQQRLSNILNNAYITWARNSLKSLQEGTGRHGEFGYQGKDYVEDKVKAIRTFIERSSKDMSALDETGQKSADEMGQILVEAEKQYRIRAARDRYNILQEHAAKDGMWDILIAKSWATEVREHFNKAGVGAACLDETGQKSDAEMEAELQAALDQVKANRDSLTSRPEARKNKLG